MANLQESTRSVWVEKNGKLLMANKYTARNFKNVDRALNFVRNLIRVSTKQKLTLENFNFIY